MITVWCMLVGDILFCVFLSHITVQFDLLCVKIKRVFYVPVDQQLIPEYPLGKITIILYWPYIIIGIYVVTRSHFVLGQS